MKDCPFCGRQNNDEKEFCQECGMKIVFFKDMKPLPISNQNKTEFDETIATSTKWQFWFGAWGGVFAVSFVINPSYILAAPLFPIGLLAWLPNGIHKSIEGWMSGAWIIGWLFYALLSVVMLLVKKSNVFFVIYIIFCILLVLNIAGCQRTLEAASKIQ